MGHPLATFASTADLLAALGRGQRFNLLLLASHDEATRSSLFAVCQALGIVPHVGTVPTREWLWHSIWKAPRREVGRAIDVRAAAPGKGDSEEIPRFLSIG